MSRGDFHVADTRDGGTPIAVKYRVDAGTAVSIKAGEWVIMDDSLNYYVEVAVTGQSNSVNWIGVAATDSDDTASLDGDVWVYDNQNYIFRGPVTTSSNLAATVRNTEVTLDVGVLATGRHSIDENDTSSGALRIIDYDSITGTADVQMSDPMIRK